ncbi:hypothetical protein OAM67_01325 [bacterium]|nr:hypothetical protein [bacterium]
MVILRILLLVATKKVCDKFKLQRVVYCWKIIRRHNKKISEWFTKSASIAQPECRDVFHVSETPVAKTPVAKTPLNTNVPLTKASYNICRDFKQFKPGPETKSEVQKFETYIIQSDTPHETRRQLAKCAKTIKSAMYFA